MFCLFFPPFFTFCVMLDWERLLKIKAIFSWTFSGGSTILSVWSVATSRVSMLVVFMEGCRQEREQLPFKPVWLYILFTISICRKTLKPIECINKVNSRVFRHQSQTHRDILLEAAGCWSGDGGGLGYCGCSRRCGDQSAGLTWLWGFGDAGLLRLSLGLDLCQCQTARGGDGALHLHRRVPWLLAILDILHTQDIERCRARNLIYLNVGIHFCSHGRVKK